MYLYLFLTLVYFVNLYLKERAAVYTYIGGFIFLSLYHVKRMYENYGGYDMDLTLILMQQLIRVTYFSWSVHDYHAKKPEDLPPSSVNRVIREEPTLLAFLSYNFNFLGMLCPSPDYFDYMEFVHERGNYEVVPMKPAQHLKVVRNAVFCIVFHVLCTRFFYSPADTITEKVMNMVRNSSHREPWPGS